jgi:fatty-acyl-CoA synthase
LLAARAGDERVGLVAGDRSWTWDEIVAESRTRAERAIALRPADPAAPFHIGVLLPNVPEYLFWLGGAALAGAVVVGINPTRRGADLARDIAFTCCQLVVTDGDGAALIDVPLDDLRLSHR